MPPLLLAEDADFTAAAFFTLYAENPLRLGKMGLALFTDQAMGRTTAFSAAGIRSKSLPIVGVGDAGDVVANPQPPQK